MFVTTVYNNNKKLQRSPKADKFLSLAKGRDIEM